MKPDEIKALLPDVEAIARTAGAEIMEFYEGRKTANVETKADGSIVTAADKAAEAIILPALRALTPDIPIVSEEDFEAGARPDISKGTFWTVDPLDGTSEFTGRTGAFVVAISLIVDNKPVLGAIYHPAFGIMFSAAGPGTATRTDADGTKHTLGPDGKAPPDELRVVMSESSVNMPLVKGYLTSQFKKAAKIDGTPDLLRAMQVAQNDADASMIYPKRREGRTKWWDVAPGHAIVEAAGGKVVGVDGKDITYDAPDFMVPPLISLSPRHVANEKAAETAAQKPAMPKKKADGNTPK